MKLTLLSPKVTIFFFLSYPGHTCMGERKQPSIYDWRAATYAMISQGTVVYKIVNLVRYTYLCESFDFLLYEDANENVIISLTIGKST